jgi:hypothetical protein
MKHIKDIDNFINEKHHVNQDVRHLTNLIYNKIYQLLPNLILKKEIVIENILQDNYTRIKFRNDKIVVKLGKNWGSVNEPIIDNNIIENLTINLSISLSDKEISQRKLINNKIKETINHECQHVIEFYHSDGSLSKSCDFDKRLKEHEKKFNNKEWLDICYFFYLSEEHEMRSRVSQSLEILKNDGDLLNSTVYKDLDFLSNLNADILISKMNKYDDFGLIIVDFVKNVLLSKGDCIKIFKSYIKTINKESKKNKKKILKLLYSWENPESILEEYIEKDINYKVYMTVQRKHRSL